MNRYFPRNKISIEEQIWWQLGSPELELANHAKMIALLMGDLFHYFKNIRKMSLYSIYLCPEHHMGERNLDIHKKVCSFRLSLNGGAMHACMGVKRMVLQSKKTLLQHRSIYLKVRMLSIHSNQFAFSSSTGLELEPHRVL